MIHKIANERGIYDMQMPQIKASTLNEIATKKFTSALARVHAAFFR